jgi:Tfp pilus assembly ATPase PilU
VNVVFSADQYNTLQRLASMQKISLSDALRQAISLSDLIVNANADPETKILLRKGDSLQELKIVR